MRIRIVDSLGRIVGTTVGLMALAFGLPSCGNEGRLELDPTPPVVKRILVQEANSYQITDLLNHTMPMECSDTNPCPVGTSGLGPTTCMDADSMGKRFCDNPTSADNAVVVGDTGTVQIRIILSKILELSGPNAAETVTTDPKTMAKTFMLSDPTAIGLYIGDKEVGVDAKYYDSTGSNTDSADPIAEPLGPALVINVTDQLIPSTTYTLKIKPSVFKDSKGQPLANDVNGPINAAGYSFKTESLYIASSAPKLTAVAPNDVVTFTTNAYVADASISVMVTDGNMMTVANAIAWPELDPKTCMGAAGNLINVFLTDGKGNPTSWTPGGTYTLTVDAKDAATGKVSLDKEGKKITVTMTPGDPKTDKQTVDHHILPVPCDNALHPMDGGIPNG